MSEDIDEVEAAIKRLAQTQEEELLPSGTVVSGRFVVQRRLGMGAMGAVYLATQKSMGREVALKTLQAHMLQHEQVLRRFYLEAKAASKLDHPNIVKIFDFGIDEDLRLPFIAMELLTGEDLTDLHLREGPFPEKMATGLLAQVAKALVEAHDKGIVHRDLKPDNIHVRRLSDGDRQCKVLDFGIAKVVQGASESEANLTGTGMTIGTPMYMSPEQVCSRPVDFRSDLYALGCILFEMVTGHPPYGAGEMDRMKVLLAHMNTRIPEVPDVLSDGQPPTDALRELVERLMAKSIDDRPGSTASVARALTILSRGESFDAAELLAPVDATVVVPNGEASDVMATLAAPALTATDMGQASSPQRVDPAQVGLATDETAAFASLDGVASVAASPQGDANQTAALAPAPNVSVPPPEPEPDAPTPVETNIAPEERPVESTPPQAARSQSGVWMALAALLLVGGVGWTALSGGQDEVPLAEPVAETPPSPSPATAPKVAVPTTPAAVKPAPTPAPAPAEAPVVVETKAASAMPAPAPQAKVKVPSRKPMAAAKAATAPKPVAKAPKPAPAKAPAAKAPAAKAPAAKAPATRPPAAKASGGPKMGGTSVRTGSLSAKDARRVMGRASGKLKSCFKRANLTERVFVRALVGGGGTVKSVSVKPASAGAFKSCIVGTIRALRFPAGTGTGFSTVEVTVKP